MIKESTDDVGPDTVLVRPPSPQVDWVEVDNEIVAWNEAREALHLLDPIASIVFQLMDGQTDLRTTVQELSDAFGQPHSEVDEAVHACVTHLIGLGMLERVL